MSKQLEAAGFVDVRRCELGDSNDAMFEQVEQAGRFVDGTLDLKELALAARKPRS